MRIQRLPLRALVLVLLGACNQFLGVEDVTALDASATIDALPSLTVEPSMLELEETLRGEIAVSLTPAPSSPVKVDLFPTDNIRLTVAALEFAPGETGPKKVGVAGRYDDDTNDATGKVELVANGFPTVTFRLATKDRLLSYGQFPANSNSTETLPANTLIAIPIRVVDAAVFISRYQAYSTLGAGKVKMALFENIEPGDKAGSLVPLSTSKPFDIVAGEASSVAIGVKVSPSRYWLAIMAQSDIELSVQTTASMTRCVHTGLSFDAPMPTTFGGTCTPESPVRMPSISAFGFR